jgi:hypothetical protein
VGGVARLAVVAALLGGRAPAQVSAPRVRVLASTEGAFRSFDEPACARSGFAVFHAIGKDGRDSIFASAGGAPVVVARAGTQVEDGPRRYTIARLGTRPTVNERFVCAFTVEWKEGGKAVLVALGATQKFEFVADSGEAYRTFGEDALVDARRSVLFRAEIDPPGHPDTAGFDRAKVTDPKVLEDPDRSIPPPDRLTVDGRRKAFHQGLFLVKLGARDVVADTQQDVLDLQDDFAFNDGGVVALIVARRPKHWTLVLDQGSRPVAVAETGTEWSAFHRPALNLLGRMAFVAEMIDGGAVVCRALAGVGRPAILADARTGFVAVGPNVSIDDRGEVAFVGQREDGSAGLFLVDLPGEARLVLPVGTAVGHAKVAGIRLSNRAFGRPGQLAALVALDPPGEAIVVLDLPR